LEQADSGEEFALEDPYFLGDPRLQGAIQRITEGGARGAGQVAGADRVAASAATEALQRVSSSTHPSSRVRASGQHQGQAPSRPRFPPRNLKGPQADDGLGIWGT